MCVHAKGRPRDDAARPRSGFSVRDGFAFITKPPHPALAETCAVQHRIQLRAILTTQSPFFPEVRILRNAREDTVGIGVCAGVLDAGR